MAIAKVLGIETEYGIAGGPDGDPIVSSSIIVNAYAQQGRTRINWDFEGETPDMDARGRPDLTSFAPVVETHLANTVLTNGARLYVDHAHPEYSSPECRSPRRRRSTTSRARRSCDAHWDRQRRRSSPTSPSRCTRTTPTARATPTGPTRTTCFARDVEFAHLIRAMVPHFVSRQIVVGAGKVGAETEAAIERDPAFQLSQRAEFFEEVVGLETTLKRPIINTRDEPHADAERFRRLHVIIGDANMCQSATMVKLGSTALLLAALEECGPESLPGDAPRPRCTPCAPSRSTLTRASAVPCEDGSRGARGTSRTSSGSWPATTSSARRGAGGRAPSEVEFILTQWREMLDGVRDDRWSVADRVDWVAKWRVVNGYRDRYDLDDHDARLRAIDLQYHDLRPEHSLAQRVGLRALVDESRFVKPFTTLRARPGPISAASASRDSPTRSSPPTGIRSSSTSATVRCNACR